MIKAISCDFWGTLARSNPMFKIERKKSLSYYTDDNVDESVKKVDSYCSIIEENYTLVVFKPEHIFFLLFQILGIDPAKINYYHLKEKIEFVFIEYPPIFDENVFGLLKEAQSNGISVIITTNTGFMSGDVLRKIVFDKSVVFDLVSSNEVGANKPNHIIFTAAMQKLQRVIGDVSCGEVIHIGDNLITDKGGATRFGMRAMHVEEFKHFNSISDLQ